MRPLSELIAFLKETMSMAEVYQPAIIRYLLEQDGEASKQKLAEILSGYDKTVQDYYQKILMRYPKKTLTKHDIVSYHNGEQLFTLNFNLNDDELLDTAKTLCESKISDWINKKSLSKTASSASASKRYRVLKASRGKCELCGISSKISPIDIDHIVPKSKANKKGLVFKNDMWIDINDEQNLQALCFRCNRAKRDTDSTDFRSPKEKLVRDFIPQIISKSGRQPIFEELKGSRLKAELFEKLTEEHVELISDKNIEEVVDVIEVALAIAQSLGYTETETMEILKEKRTSKGGFYKGYYLKEIQS